MTIIRRKVLRRKYFLRVSCCMCRPVLGFSCRWIGCRLISLGIPNVRSLGYLPNINIWFLRIILRIWPSIPLAISIISQFKRHPISYRELRSLNLMRMRSIMVLLRERNQRLRSLLNMVLVLLLLMVSRLMITLGILIIGLRPWNPWYSRKLRGCMIWSLML